MNRLPHIPTGPKRGDSGGPALIDELSRRVGTLPGRVLPGLGPIPPASADAVLFVIGPERQFASWDRYLKSVDATNPAVHRLYGRDFWLIDDEAVAAVRP